MRECERESQDDIYWDNCRECYNPQRLAYCNACGITIDRDLNAAINLCPVL